jgi:hypothetical protein
METIKQNPAPPETTESPKWSWQDNLAGAPAPETYAIAGSAEDAQVEEADDIEDDADEPAMGVAPPPEEDTDWLPHDPQGTGGEVKVAIHAGVMVTVEAHFQARRPRAIARFDTAGESLRVRALEKARGLDVVKKWFAAKAEEQRHARAARVARKEAEAIVARRELLVAEGTDPNLAARLKDMAAEQREKIAAAEQAEDLLVFAKEAVAARHAEAAKAIAAAHRDAVLAELIAAQRHEKAAIAKLAEVAGPALDAVVAAVRARLVIGTLTVTDRGPLARQLLARLEADATLAASQPTTAPAA